MVEAGVKYKVHIQHGSSPAGVKLWISCIAEVSVKFIWSGSFAFTAVIRMACAKDSDRLLPDFIMICG